MAMESTVRQLLDSVLEHGISTDFDVYPILFLVPQIHRAGVGGDNHACREGRIPRE